MNEGRKPACTREAGDSWAHSLSAGNDFDRSFTRLEGSSAELNMSHNLVHTLPTAGAIRLECVSTSSVSATLLEFIKITATKVNSVSDAQLP